jgi:hypothetical protein
VAEVLPRWSIDWVVDPANRLDIIKRLFGEDHPLPPVKEGRRQYLKGLLADEITKLESLFQADLQYWR